MIRHLAKIFINDYENVEDKTVRERYGILGGVLGIICNLFLFGLKLTIGLMMKSVAIMSDAFNNLSDMGSCFVAIIGARLSNLVPDREHPFGHGRFEYISSLIVSFIIMLVGFELLKTSADKVIHPEEMAFSVPLICILAASVLVKLWMFSYYSYIAKMISSSVMKATARDSLNDVISTSAVIAATVIGHFLPFSIDGIIGLLVAGFIIYGGFGMAKETIDLLLGGPPSPELVEKLRELIMSGDEITGVHDLMVHDYGPGRVFASAHAEVPDNVDIVAAHETIDAVEKKIFHETGVLMVIHMDPVCVNCERTNELKSMVQGIVKEYDPEYSIHDFRVTDGENNINLIFDLVLKGKFTQQEKDKAAAYVSQAVKTADSRCQCVITVDVDFS